LSTLNPTDVLKSSVSNRQSAKGTSEVSPVELGSTRCGGQLGFISERLSASSAESSCEMRSSVSKMEDI